MLPDCWDVGVAVGEIEEVCEEVDAGGTKVFKVVDG